MVIFGWVLLFSFFVVAYLTWGLIVAVGVAQVRRRWLVALAILGWPVVLLVAFLVVLVVTTKELIEELD